MAIDKGIDKVHYLTSHDSRTGSSLILWMFSEVVYSKLFEILFVILSRRKRDDEKKSKLSGKKNSTIYIKYI